MADFPDPFSYVNARVVPDDEDVAERMWIGRISGPFSTTDKYSYDNSGFDGGSSPLRGVY